MRISSLALLALAVSLACPEAASRSERTGTLVLKDAAKEDEAYWSLLTTETDMSVSTPTPMPPPPPTPLPTLPTVPTTTSEECLMNVEIFCSADGIECRNLSPPINPEDCIFTAIYSFRVTNIGTTDMTLSMAEITVNDDDPVSVLGSFPVTEVAPGDEIFGIQQLPINLCGTEQTTTLNIIANTDIGNECNGMDVYVL